MSYISFNGKSRDENSGKAEQSYDFPECIDFVPIRTSSTTKYMAVARESEAIPINVWVAEAPRMAIIEDEVEQSFDGKIAVSFA